MLGTQVRGVLRILTLSFQTFGNLHPNVWKLGPDWYSGIRFKALKFAEAVPRFEQCGFVLSVKIGAHLWQKRLCLCL